METRMMTRRSMLLGFFGVISGCYVTDPDDGDVPKLNPKWAVWGMSEQNETLLDVISRAGHGPSTKPTKHGIYLTSMETHPGSDWWFTLVDLRGTPLNLAKSVSKMELEPGWIWGGWPLTH